MIWVATKMTTDAGQIIIGAYSNKAQARRRASQVHKQEHSHRVFQFCRVFECEGAKIRLIAWTEGLTGTLVTCG